VLTCSHCFADTEEEWRACTEKDKRKWLLYYTGLAVQIECRVWDGTCDLALCKVIAIEIERGTKSEGKMPTFAFVSLSAAAPKTGEPILCIGQPGRDDLEAPRNKKTSYRLVEVSNGNFRGMMKGVDPHDNREIGALKHDAWTYWGHSGAPLLRVGGELVGLHSSWDDRAAMRHGIPAVAIRWFLERHLPGASSLLSVLKQGSSVG
jgi:Trypsin-like peptidase domain